MWIGYVCRYVTFRVSSSSRCLGISAEGQWALDDDARPRHLSRVGLCALDPATWRPVECVAVASVATGSVRGLEEAHFTLDLTGFLGPEDPRAFSLEGSLFVLVNVGVVYTGTQVQRAVNVGVEPLRVGQRGSGLHQV